QRRFLGNQRRQRRGAIVRQERQAGDVLGQRRQLRIGQGHARAADRVIDRLGVLVQDQRLAALLLVLDGADLGTARQRPFGDHHVVVLQERAFRELVGRQRLVVGRDIRVFLGQGVGPVALRFEQEVESAATGQELLEAGGELLGKRFALGPQRLDALL